MAVLDSSDSFLGSCQKSVQCLLGLDMMPRLHTLCGFLSTIRFPQWIEPASRVLIMARQRPAKARKLDQPWVELMVEDMKPLNFLLPYRWHFDGKLIGLLTSITGSYSSLARSFDVEKDEHPVKFVLQNLSLGMMEALQTWVSEIIKEPFPHPSGVAVPETGRTLLSSLRVFNGSVIIPSLSLKHGRN